LALPLANSAKAQREKLPKSTHEQLPCHRPQTARNRQSTAAATDTKDSPTAPDASMAPLAPVPRARRPPPDVPVYDVNDSRPASAAPSEHFADPPDVTISTGVGMRGELSFPKLLRVEGHFAGTLTCGGDVVIAPGGTLEADVDNANGYLLVEGTVLGNVNARRVQIAATGRVFGDITCNSFIIAPGAVVIGACQVRPEPPEKNLG
jgi:cytoskeletal protein CcmA (bactofilin family)